MVEVNQAAGKEWLLVALQGKAITAKKPPTMKFEKGRLSIFGGINRMGGFLCSRRRERDDGGSYEHTYGRST